MANNRNKNMDSAMDEAEAKFQKDAGFNQAPEEVEDGGTFEPVEGGPVPEEQLTPFERESIAFFKEQNELEAEVDEAEVTPEQQAVFAGTPVNVFQSGALGPVGSATVTTYVGETIHPYPPTDYNAAAIVAGDLTTDPILAQVGLVATNPMPPENNVHDIRETDGRVDTKDFSRLLRAPVTLIVEARRTKYPSTEAPI